jgi:hypothetical protein
VALTLQLKKEINPVAKKLCLKKENTHATENVQNHSHVWIRCTPRHQTWFLLPNFVRIFEIKCHNLYVTGAKGVMFVVMSLC